MYNDAKHNLCWRALTDKCSSKNRTMNIVCLLYDHFSISISFSISSISFGWIPDQFRIFSRICGLELTYTNLHLFARPDTENYPFSRRLPMLNGVHICRNSNVFIIWLLNKFRSGKTFYWLHISTSIGRYTRLSTHNYEQRSFSRLKLQFEIFPTYILYYIVMHIHFSSILQN